MKKRSRSKPQSRRSKTKGAPSEPLIEWIKASYAEGIVKRCSEEGCRLKLTGVRDRVILNGEKVVSQGKKADYVIFWAQNAFIVAVIELKSTPSDISKIRSQLEACFRKAVEILKRAPEMPAGDMRVVCSALAKGWSTPRTRRIRDVRIAGKYPVLPMECGVDLPLICKKGTMPLPIN